MVKKFSSGIERENTWSTQLSEPYECPKCNESITNPICHNCLGEQISSWLALYPDIKKKMMPKLKNYISSIEDLEVGNTNCISCSKKKATLCPYCFAEAVYYLLKKNKINSSIIGDFLMIFNFDMKHEGYLNEAIRDGFY